MIHMQRISARTAIGLFRQADGNSDKHVNRQELAKLAYQKFEQLERAQAEIKRLKRQGRSNPWLRQKAARLKAAIGFLATFLIGGKNQEGFFQPADQNKDGKVSQKEFQRIARLDGQSCDFSMLDFKKLDPKRYVKGGVTIDKSVMAKIKAIANKSDIVAPKPSPGKDDDNDLLLLLLLLLCQQRR